MNLILKVIYLIDRGLSVKCWSYKIQCKVILYLVLLEKLRTFVLSETE